MYFFKGLIILFEMDCYTDRGSRKMAGVVLRWYFTNTQNLFINMESILS